MSKPWRATDEDGEKLDLDNLSTQKWLEGHHSGLDMAVNYLNERAVELFRQRKGTEAAALQTLADDMKKKLEPEISKRAREHEKEFPHVITGDDS